MSLVRRTRALCNDAHFRSGLRWGGCLAVLAVVLVGNEVRLAHPGGQAKADAYVRAINAVKVAQADVATARR